MNSDCPVCHALHPHLQFQVRGNPIYRCGVCTAYFRPVWELPPADVQGSQLAAFGEKYTRSRRTIAFWLRFEAMRTLRTVRRYSPPPGRLVEIGCATGEFCLAARDMGYHVEGVELSETAAEFARREYGLEVHASALEKLASAKPGAFNVVVAIHTLEHLADQNDAMRRIKGLLAPGGHVIIEVPSASSWDFRLRGVEASMFTDEHLYFHTVSSLNILLSNAGFDVVDIRTVEGYSGMFNSLLQLAGAQRLIAGTVRRLRSQTEYKAQASLQSQDASVAGPASSYRELALDFGRSALLGMSTIAGLVGTPIRVATGSLGLGGSLVVVARKTKENTPTRRSPT